jgi:beta-lactamase class A
MITRRHFVVSSVAAAMVCPAHAGQPRTDFSKLPGEFGKIERESGGRLGVAVLDTVSGETANYRGDERFPMCSTFKVLAAAAVLTRVENGQERLDRAVHFGRNHIVENSPITSVHISEGHMTLAELCEAAITVSDNTAGNLLLANIGGPQGLTSFARSLGDNVTRLDRIEPTLNEALPNDPRDTTSPKAMLSDIKSLVLGTRLKATSRKQLTEWLLGNKTGGARLRGRLDPKWRVADKTGSGERGTTNDAGVIWPPNGDPLIVSIFLTGSSDGADARNATIAAVGQAMGAAIKS